MLISARWRSTFSRRVTTLRCADIAIPGGASSRNAQRWVLPVQYQHLCGVKAVWMRLQNTDHEPLLPSESQANASSLDLRPAGLESCRRYVYAALLGFSSSLG